MSIRKGFIVFTLLLMFAFPMIVLNGQALAEKDSATLAIDRAEGVVVSAFQGVLEADGAGADVSELSAQLNVALDLLAQARVLYRVGDFEGASSVADVCFEICEGVEAEAYRLRDLAVEEAIRRFWLTIIGWVVCVGVIVFGSFFGWRAFKGRYFRGVLRMRPEVASGGS